MPVFFPIEVIMSINRQINNELYSAYLYEQLAALCDGFNLPGFAHWHRKQAQEELTHAQRFVTYLSDSDAEVVFDTIVKPNVPSLSVQDPLEAFRVALEHEYKVTEQIRLIADIAMRLGDHRSYAFVQWYLIEQTEEVNTLLEIIARYQLDGGEATLEKELGQR